VRRLVEPAVPSRAVDADRAAVHEALDARLLADVEEVAGASHVHGAKVLDAGVRLVLGRREMKDGIRGLRQPPKERDVVELADHHANPARLERPASRRFERRVLGAESDDVVTFDDQVLREPRPDEAGRPGAQCVHPPISPWAMRCRVAASLVPPLCSSFIALRRRDWPTFTRPLCARTRERLALAHGYPLRSREPG